MLNLIRNVFKIPLLEKLLVRLTVGKQYGSFFTKFPPHHYQYVRNTTRSVKRDGINFQLDISDIIDWYIYYGFKEQSKANLYSLIATGDCVIDIGANVGEISLNIAKLAGQTGQIYSFEPDETNFSRLTKNISLNGLRNIHPLNLGVGDTEGEFVLTVVEDKNRGMNRISEGINTNSPFSLVKVIRLDDYVRKADIRKINLIKIDTEGFEMKILLGGRSTIEQHRPVLFIELDDNNLKEQNSNASSLVGFLEKINYNIEHATTGLKIESSAHFSNCHFDIIAKPAELID